MSMDEVRAAGLEALSDYEDEIAGLTRDVRRAANGKLKATRKALKSGFGRARDSASHAVSQARDGAVDAYDHVDDLMRQRPLVTLGIGLAIGALAALAISRLASRD